MDSEVAVGTVSDVATTTEPVLVADKGAAVAKASPLSITQSDAPLHVYPKGQHCEPQVGSWPVKSVLWTTASGKAVTL